MAEAGSEPKSGADPEVGVKADSKAKGESGATAVADAEGEAAPGHEAEGEAESVAGAPPEAEAEPKPEAEAEPGAAPEAEAEFQPKSEADAETAPEADAEAGSGAEGEPEAGVEAGPDPMAAQAGSGAESGAEREPESDAGPEGDAEAESGVEGEPETELAPEVEAGSQEAEPLADLVDGQVVGSEADLSTEPAGSDEPEEEIETDELPELTDAELENALEALLLVVDSPVEEDALATALGAPLARITVTLRRLAERYTDQQSGIDLRRAGGGWRYYTRDRYAPYVEKLLLDGQRAKLTRAALETLAVIAYRQPVTRARVAAVRGVNCDGVIRTLLARGLVEETGTDLETGGYLYRTTELFLERLGLSSLEDLPPIAPLLPEVDSIDDI